MSAYLGDFRTGKTIRKMWSTTAIAGESITRATNGTVSVYKDGGTTQSTAGVTDTEDFDTLTGVHLVAIDTSADGTFYSAAAEFEVVLSAATIDGKVINTTLFSFSLENRSALMPTTDGRKLDVSATGEAGLDWANVGSPTTTLGLSGTTVGIVTTLTGNTAQTGDTYALANGANGFVATKADTAAILVDTGTTLDGRIPAALVGGRMDANMGAISSDATAADNAEAFFDGTGYAGTGNVIPTVTLVTTATTLTNDPAGVTTLLSRLPAGLFTGLTNFAQWLGLLGAKQVGNTTARTELNATGAGSGTYDETTDSTQAIRDAGATITDLGVLASTTIATLASQTSFTITLGSPDNDAYNGSIAIITDASTAVQKAVAFVADYVGGTKTITLKYDPGIFTMAVGDGIVIMPPQVAPSVKKGFAFSNFEFAMIDSTDDISGKTGVTVTAERSIDGAAFGACSNAVAEVASGMYKITLSATDMAGDVISLKFTGTGCNATLITLVTEP